MQSRSVVESVNLIPHSGRRYGTDTSRQRQDHARRPSSDTAIEGFDQRARRSLRSQPEDGDEVEKASLVHDAAMGPKAPHSTVLSAEEEALAVAFRKHTLLSLDDCLYALQATIPHLTRSSLHRLFQRHSISRLPAIEGETKQQEGVQALPNRLLPHRHRRSAHRRRQTPSVRCYRSNFEVCVRAAP